MRKVSGRLNFKGSGRYFIPGFSALPKDKPPRHSGGKTLNWKSLLLPLLMGMCPVSLFANTIYFPQVAFGGGYSTTFVILNTGTNAVSGPLNFYTPAGSIRGDLSTQLNIPVGGSVRVTVPNTGPLTIAWAQFVAGSGKVQGVSTFDLRTTDGTLITSAGVLGIEGSTRFVIPVDVTQTGSTGLAISNASGTSLSLNLQLISEDGTLVMTGADRRFQPLGARAQVADFITNIFPQLATTTFKGTLSIEAPPGTSIGALAATALMVKENKLAALPVIAAGSAATTLEFPQVAFGDGYTTTLTIVNTSSTAVAGTLRFYSQSGAVRQDLAATVNIPAGGSFRDVLPDVGALTVVWGELIVTAGAVQGVAVFELRGSDGTLITTAGVPAVQPGNGYTLPIDTSGTSSTGIAVADAQDSTLNVGYRLTKEDGSVANAAATARYTALAARGQASDFATNIFPQIDANFRGTLSMETANGSSVNSLAAAAVTVKEGLLSALPVIPDTISACKLPEAANRGDIGLGFPRYFLRMPTTGTVRAKVLFVDFSDAPASQTPQQVFSVINPGAPQYYYTVSYGRLNYVLDPYFVWLRMSKPSTGYGWSSLTAALHQAYIQEAVSLADPSVDFSNVDIVIVMANPAATALPNGPAFTGGNYSADGKTFYNAVTSGADLTYWGSRWLNHEAGHTMGLVDLYAFRGDTHRFVGGFDMMGLISGLAPEYLAYDRWLLGWLDDAQISCQLNSDSTVTLTAIEQPGGIKAVMVPTGPTSLVVVESRRTLGFDSGLTKTGALVYTVDSSVLSGNGPMQVYPNLTDKYQSPLMTGDQVTVGKVTITVTHATSSGDTVRVVVAP
jgi:M6 family metalloprotease-like protein